MKIPPCIYSLFDILSLHLYKDPQLQTGKHTHTHQSSSLSLLSEFEYELEDEIHFLFVCEGYSHFRSKYLFGCYEFENLIFLQDPNINVSRKIAMYIFHALKYCEEFMTHNLA